ncbi:hypothetical protein INT46_007785 [Mucor plumbeus]|uniref:Uncharacterized protein n=1 Tax=Mucor plumbeus TaxID=97098 RepID=A0A8H7UZE7_9FUNG|nr:hypothetical protein INT46_007785 [Mucor plumbeus]
MSKSVQFHVENPTVWVTYGPAEYDRSSCSSSSMYKFAPTTSPPPPVNTTSTNNQTKQSRPFIKPLDLSMIPNSSRRSVDPGLDSIINKKTTKLSVDTRTMVPSFFSAHCEYQEEEEGLDDISILIMVYRLNKDTVHL